jgi:AraC-like DNA-binding protein
LAGPDSFEEITFSSRTFAHDQRADAFRELFGRNILKLEMDPLQGEPFDAVMNVRALPGLAVATSQMSPMVCRHPSSMIDNDDPVIVFLKSGIATYQQNGCETTIRAGEAILTTNGLAGTGTGHTTTDIINWRISRALIAPLVPNLDEAIGRKIDTGNIALQLFLGYVGILNERATLAQPDVRRAVGSHLLDLGAMILGPRWDAAEMAQTRGVAAARMHSIKAGILAELANPNLSAADIAANNGISMSYIRKLFEAEGTTFTEFVLGHRLSMVYRMLTDVRFASRSISRIAHDAGFNDLSYFNRTFRRAYGSSPSDLRRELRAQDRK